MILFGPLKMSLTARGDPGQGGQELEPDEISDCSANSSSRCRIEAASLAPANASSFEVISRLETLCTR